MVELEGQKRGKYWTFSIVDPSGLNLLRMSSENQAESEKWIRVSRGDTEHSDLARLKSASLEHVNA